jgi:hypothetical protein
MDVDEQARLAIELQYFALHKTDWLTQHAGKYVVIKDTTVLGFYPTFEAAYRDGASKWTINADFLVKRIAEHEPVFFVF